MPHITEMPMEARMEKMKKGGKMKFRDMHISLLDDNSITVNANYESEGGGGYNSKRYSYPSIDEFMKVMKNDFFSHFAKTNHLAKKS